MDVQQVHALSGCDYCDTLKGVGPSTAIRLLVQHGSLEKVLEELGPEKVPDNFRYQEARQFFKECEAVNTQDVDFKWEEPSYEGLEKFLVEQCSFAKERVEKYLERLRKTKSTTKQRPLDSFFGTPKVVIRDGDKFDPTKKKGAAKAGATKRKAPGAAGGPAAKRGKA